jgi:hypothetical protein
MEKRISLGSFSKEFESKENQLKSSRYKNRCKKLIIYILKEHFFI